MRDSPASFEEMGCHVVRDLQRAARQKTAGGSRNWDWWQLTASKKKKSTSAHYSKELNTVTTTYMALEENPKLQKGAQLYPTS